MGLLGILYAIMGISVLVIVHESGHYLVARAFGMRVIRYSIGLGPAIFRYKPKDSPTTFQVCAVPFLAYVQIAGMNPHEDVDPKDPELFPNKGIFARIATIAAGPIANYIAASALIFGLALFAWPSDKMIEPMTVGVVGEGTPAATAGLEIGDVILEANGVAVANIAELIEVTGPRAEQPTTYIVERDGRRLPPMSITPEDIDGRGIIGVRPMGVYEGLPIAKAAEYALLKPIEITFLQIAGVTKMLSERTMEDLTGPVGMVKAAEKSAARGVPDFVILLITLSLALGFFNLLPFPALDGGRLVFLGYELITRKRPNERIEAWVHTVGILFLLGVLVLVTYRDFMG